MNPIEKFHDDKQKRIEANGRNAQLDTLASDFMKESILSHYSYNFSWLGIPVIQYPQDLLAMQQLIWTIKPDVIIDVGIAHGGTTIFYASLLELIGKGKVIGVDIDIRKHNRDRLEQHPLFKRVDLVEGSSIDDATLDTVKKYIAPTDTVLVSLDSNHTHEHVLQELQYYSPLVSAGSYLVVFDTIIEAMPKDTFLDRPWNVGDNPKTAIDAFLKENKMFLIDNEIDNQLMISAAKGGYLKRVSVGT